MSFNQGKRKRIVSRTDSRCHICWGPITLDDYGKIEGEEAWEVDHSKAQAKGGTDHLNNFILPISDVIPRNKTETPE